MKKIKFLFLSLFVFSFGMHAQNIGVGTDTPNVKALMHVELGHDLHKGFLVSGTQYSGISTFPDFGAGTRLMFYPAKAAFRAGQVTGTQWNNQNVGDNSTALGLNVTASGGSSVALGETVSATGLSSTAMGSSTLAAGNYSTAIGFFTAARGFISTAIGYASTARATASTVIGEGLVARGYASTVIGMYNDSIITSAPETNINQSTPLFIIGNGGGSNQRSNAMTVQKNGNVIIGNGLPDTDAQLHINTGTSTTKGLLVTGAYSVDAEVPDLNAGTRMMFYPAKSAFRAGTVNGAQWNDINVGFHSVAMGQHTIATGNNSTAFGYAVTASGLYSTAMGNNTTASSPYSTALGNSTKATNNFATAMGNSTQATALSSTAMGNATRATAAYSTAIGHNTIAAGAASTVVGVYNDSLITGSGQTNVTEATPLFIVGNGNANNDRSNALVVYKNGDTEINNLKFLSVGGGTTYAKQMAGEINAGTNPGSGFKTFTYVFPTPFSNTPKVLATAKNDPGFSNVNDCFVVSVRSVSSTQVIFNIQRVDLNSGWSQQLRIEWMAWE